MKRYTLRGTSESNTGSRRSTNGQAQRRSRRALLFTLLIIGATTVLVPLLNIMTLRPVAAASGVNGYSYTNGNCTAMDTIVSSAVSGNSTVTLGSSGTNQFSGSYVVYDASGSPSYTMLLKVTTTKKCDPTGKLYKNGSYQGTINITVPPSSTGGGTTAGYVGTWIDHSDISLSIGSNALIFHDNRIDNNLNYQVAAPGCPAGDNDVISGFGGGNQTSPSKATNTVDITIWSTSGVANNTQCIQTPAKVSFTPSSAGLFNDYFVWRDASTISTSDTTEMTLAQSAAGQPFLDSGGGLTDSKCKSQITASPGASIGTLVIWHSSSQNPFHTQVGWPSNISSATLNDNGSGCYVSGPIQVAIANPQTATGPASSLAAGSSGAGAGSGTATAPSIDCHVSFVNPLSWFLCPLASGLETVAGGLDNVINNYLDLSQVVSQLDYYKGAFNSIRDISLGLIGAGSLLAIISQAAGLELLDAYMIRKVLPRLLICAIGISLAWPLLKFAINVSDGLGTGVRQIIYIAANGHNSGTGTISSGGGATVVENIVGGAAIANLGFVGLLSFAATAALAAGVAFLVLIIRQMAVVMLVIFAPIAIAAYLLPNTNKVWKLWWDSFSKALLMFPIIVGFIALGRVFATITNDNIVAFVSYFAPYLLLPLTFKLAGGLVGGLGGAIHGRSQGAFGGLKNFRGNQAKKRRANAVDRAQTGRIFRKAPEGSIRSRVNTGVQGATLLNQAGFRPTKMRENIAAARAKTELQHLAHAGEKSTAFSTFQGNDDMLEAAQAGKKTAEDARAYLSTKGYAGRDLDQGVALIEQARKDLGVDGLALASAVANGGTGTGYANGAGQMFDSILKASGGNMAVATSAYATARSKAEGARRYDLLGGGFNDGLNHIKAINQAATPTERAAAIEAANEQSADMAVETQGIGAVMGGRGQSGRNLVPAVQRKLNKSQQAMIDISTGNAPMVPQTDATGAVVRDAANNVVTRPMRMEEAEREWIQGMAQTSAAIDIAGSAAPEVGRLMADSVMNSDIVLANLPTGLQDILKRGGSAPVLKPDGSQALNPDGTPQMQAAPRDITKISTYEAMQLLEIHPAFGQSKKVYAQQYQDQATRGGATPPTPGAMPPINPVMPIR